MAEKNGSILKIKRDTKNVKLIDATDIALSSEKNIAVEEEQDSVCCEKELDLSDVQPIEMKHETDVLNEVVNILGNKSSTLSRKILITAPSTATDTIIKKEIISNEEILSKAPGYTPTPIKSVNLQANKVNLDDTTIESQALSDGNKKGGNNVIRLAVKDLSDEQRKQIRAKRFNIIVAESSQNVKKVIPNPAPYSVNKPTSISANNPTPTYNVLKKRAERFGENVSTVMKSLDDKEKMLKRKLKFLESVTNLKELEVKKKRAEKFRMV